MKNEEIDTMERQVSRLEREIAALHDDILKTARVGIVHMEQSQRLRAELAEARKQMRGIAGGSLDLVRCGCRGCLTDDCEHWDKDCKIYEYTLCHIGRTVEKSALLAKEGE